MLASSDFFVEWSFSSNTLSGVISTKEAQGPFYDCVTSLQNEK